MFPSDNTRSRQFCPLCLVRGLHRKSCIFLSCSIGNHSVFYQIEMIWESDGNHMERDDYVLVALHDNHGTGLHFGASEVERE